MGFRHLFFFDNQQKMLIEFLKAKENDKQLCKTK